MNNSTKEGLLLLNYRCRVEDEPYNIEHPDWKEIEDAINKVVPNGGFLKLYNTTKNDAYIHLLGIDSIGDQFRIVLLTNSDDHKKSILEWWEPEDSPFRGKTLFGDDAWDNRTICADINTAYEILKEFHTKQDLTEGLENMRSTWDIKP